MTNSDHDHNNLKMIDWGQDHNNLTHNLGKAKDTEQRFIQIMSVDQNTLKEDSMNYNENKSEVTCKAK